MSPIGASHPKSPYSAPYQQGGYPLDNKFYEKVMGQLHGTDAVLIFGPGEAKVELLKRIAHQTVNVPIVGVKNR